MQKMKAAGYSDFAASVFAGNTGVKVVVDGRAGKVYRKGKGAVGNVAPNKVNEVAAKFKFKNPYAVQVNF